MVYSKNKRAEELVGFRRKGTPIDLPCELDYYKIFEFQRKNICKKCYEKRI